LSNYFRHAGEGYIWTTPSILFGTSYGGTYGAEAMTADIVSIHKFLSGFMVFVFYFEGEKLLIKCSLSKSSCSWCYALHTHVAKLSFYLKINAGIGGNIYFTHNGNPDWPVFFVQRHLPQFFGGGMNYFVYAFIPPGFLDSL